MPLISFDEALAAMRAELRSNGQTRTSPSLHALGHVLRERIVAREPYPRFDSSAVDGYAFATEAPARCVGSIVAGVVWPQPLEPGTCVRIMTGAMPPLGATSISMQEDVEVAGDLVTARSFGDFIRRAGSEFEAGEVLFEAGQPVNAGVLAVLASQGIEEVAHSLGVRGATLTTGDEIVAPSVQPGPGQLRDSNQAMLRLMALTHSVGHVSDDRNALRERIAFEAGKSDVLVVVGGASVGDRDFVASVVAELGEVIFHGVKIRPGKPVLFGKIGDCAVFGLPGNPASAFVCFQLFVQEARRRIEGYLHPEPRWIEMPFGGDHAPCGREDFVRVELEGAEAKPVGEQASFGLRSLAAAQALARLPADRTVKQGELCQVLLLPGPHQ